MRGRSRRLSLISSPDSTGGSTNATVKMTAIPGVFQCIPSVLPITGRISVRCPEMRALRISTAGPPPYATRWAVYGVGHKGFTAEKCSQSPASTFNLDFIGMCRTRETSPRCSRYTRYGSFRKIRTSTSIRTGPSGRASPRAIPPSGPSFLQDPAIFCPRWRIPEPWSPRSSKGGAVPAENENRLAVSQVRSWEVGRD